MSKPSPHFVVPLRLSVGAVFEVLLVGVDNSGREVSIGRRFMVLSRVRNHVQPIEDLPDMIDHVSPKSCSV
jgi:hypothetical protein